ncbi:MAG: hypothetical protein V1926_01975 [Candidatus Peregrinibacteria bacterium]
MRLRFIVLTAWLLTLLPTALFAAQTAFPELTADQKTQLFRICQNLGPDKIERCKARQLARAKRTGGMSRPTDAYILYDKKMDRGQGNLREKLRLERKTKYQIEVAKTRKTLGEFTPTEDVNTSRIPYLNDLRSAQLACMKAPPGRQRSTCLKDLNDTFQKKMRAYRLEQQTPPAQ